MPTRVLVAIQALLVAVAGALTTLAGFQGVGAVRPPDLALDPPLHAADRGGVQPVTLPGGVGSSCTQVVPT